MKAQQPTTRNFITSEYNGGTQNWCIDQTADKRMLFANNNGLFVFDSENWFSFAIANYTIIRSIYYDKTSNYIYAGASNEFGYYQLNPSSYATEYVSLSKHLPQKEKYFEEIWSIKHFEGNIIFQSKKSVFIYKPKTKITIIHTKYRIENAAVIHDKLILACKEIIYYLKKGHIYKLQHTEILRDKSVRAIMQLKNGKIIFATASDGLFVYDGHSTTPLVMDITPFLKDNQIFCGEINENMMALGTVRGGLVVKNINNGQNFYANILTGLQNNTILSLFFDYRNNIWLGLDQGISYVLIDAPYKELFGSSSQYGSGYASLCYDNKLYLGTNQGLFITHYPVSNSPSPDSPLLIPNMAGQVWSIRNIYGKILCGNNDGAYQIDGTKAQKIAGPEGTWDFKALRHHPGYVLSCDYQGLFILKRSKRQMKFVNRIRNFDEISAIFDEDNDGSIWVAHWQKGIYHLWLDRELKRVVKMTLYNAHNGLPTNANNIISKIDGNIYISAADGFYLYDKKSNRLKKYFKFDRLFKPIANPIRLFETPSHNIWAVNKNSLAIARINSKGQYALDTLSYRNIGQRLQSNLGHINFIDNAHTIFNTENGFLKVANYYTFKKDNTRLFIRRITGTNTHDTILYTNSPVTKELELKIPHSQNSIKLEYVWPEYDRDKAVTYSCYLDKYDTRWSAPQSVVSKEYTKLQKGTYTFHVKGYNNISGITQETEIKLTILPAWYETWLAYIIYLILLVYAIYLIIKYIRFRYNKKIKIIEAKRKRELKEQEALFEIERQKKEKEVIKLQKDQLETELKHKTSELADSTMNLIRKNDMLQALDNDLNALSESVRREEAKQMITRKIHDIHLNIQSNIKEDENWEKFEENFNLVYDNYMKKLCERFPQLKIFDRKLCAYLRMGLSSKEMASLLNTSVRSIETARYRLRKKLELDHELNLTEFIQSQD